MNNYKTIYDFAQDPNSFSYENNLFIGLAGALLLAFIYHKGIKKYKVATIIMGVLAIILSITTTYIQYSEYNKIVAMMEKGETQSLEGKIEQYKPIDIDNHASVESFYLNGVRFAYSDYHRIKGYHHACKLGGAICKDNQQVKIEYYTNDNLNYIVKIETLENEAN